MIQWNLDTRSGIPLYVQLQQKIIQLIIQGDWEPSYQLPSVRQMAVHMSVNVNTVARVYNELEREGYIRTHQGKGTFVQAREYWHDNLHGREATASTLAKQAASMAQAQGISVSELIRALRHLDNA